MCSCAHVHTHICPHMYPVHETHLFVCPPPRFSPPSPSSPLPPTHTATGPYFVSFFFFSSPPRSMTRLPSMARSFYRSATPSPTNPRSSPLLSPLPTPSLHSPFQFSLDLTFFFLLPLLLLLYSSSSCASSSSPLSRKVYGNADLSKVMKMNGKFRKVEDHIKVRLNLKPTI